MKNIRSIRIGALALACAVGASVTIAFAEVGGSVRSEIAHVQFSQRFRNVAIDHGAIAGGLQRWQFAVANLQQYSFTIDGTGIDGTVVRETYVVKTQEDPYSLRPGPDQAELHDVLSPSEYRDLTRAALVATVAETPIHVTAYFYRGALAAYEVLEPSRRSYGPLERFEWRAFKLSELQRTIARARNCDNGEDCSAWF